MNERKKKKRQLLKNDHRLTLKTWEAQDLGDEFSCQHVSVYFLFFILSFAASIPAGIGLVCAEQIWVKLLWLMLPTVMFILNRVIREIKVIQILRKEFDFKLPNFDELKPAEYVNIYLNDEIGRLREDLLGRTSQLSRIKGRLARTDEQARTVRAQLERRCDGENTPEYLTDAHERIQDTCQRIAAKRETLDEYTARIEAFLRECQAQVKRVQQPLSDLELIRETNRLCEETEQLEIRAAAVVVRTTSELTSRMLETKNRLYRQFESAGVSLALASAETGDALKNFQLLESTIGKFVPADKVLEAESEETSAAG
ncbi:MAG: hypothetical protein ABIH67_01005 [Candidatus Uhrbacteria bacterium]